ncbi:Spy0128 family protein, partial [Enterococcus faecium]
MIKKWISFSIAIVFILLPNTVLAQSQTATIDLMISNTVSGNQESISPFTFQIEGKDDAPIPSSNQVTINSSGKAKFGPITYNNIGTYYYTVWRVNNGLADYSDDISVYTIKVAVTYRFDNPNQLIATAIAYKSGENTKKDLVFHTTYKATKNHMASSERGKKYRFLPKTGELGDLLVIIGVILTS